MTLAQRHWSGKHKAVVEGINLLTLLWIDGDRPVPTDFRVYNKREDALTKNDHFRPYWKPRTHAAFSQSAWFLIVGTVA